MNNWAIRVYTWMVWRQDWDTKLPLVGRRTVPAPLASRCLIIKLIMWSACNILLETIGAIVFCLFWNKRGNVSYAVGVQSHLPDSKLFLQQPKQITFQLNSQCWLIRFSHSRICITAFQHCLPEVLCLWCDWQLELPWVVNNPQPIFAPKEVTYIYSKTSNQ